jgi:hypothetical protein
MYNEQQKVKLSLCLTMYHVMKMPQSWPHPEPDESSFLLLQNPFEYILPSTPRSSEVVSSFQVFRSEFYMHFSFLPYGLLHNPSIPPPRLDHPNNIQLNVKAVKLLIMQSSSASCCILPLRSQYSPLRPVLYLCPSFSVRKTGK